MSGTVIDPDTLNEKDYVYNGMIFIIYVIAKEESFRQIYRTIGRIWLYIFGGKSTNLLESNNKDTLYQVGYNTSVHGIY